MTKVTTTRKAVQSDNNTNSNDKPVHFVNIYQNGIQIGYMTIDKQPKLVAKCQADDDFMNRLLKHKSVNATYRETGVSSKPDLDLDDI